MHISSVNINNSINNNEKTNFKGKKKSNPEIQYRYDFLEDSYVPQTQPKKTGIGRFFKNPIKAARKEAEEILRQAREDANAMYRDAFTDRIRIQSESERKAKEFLQEKHDEAIEAAKTSAKDEIDRITEDKKRTIENKLRWLEESYHFEEEVKKQEHEKIMAKMTAEEEELQQAISTTQAFFDSLRRHRVEEEIAEIKAAMKEKINSYQIDYNYNDGLQTSAALQSANTGTAAQKNNANYINIQDCEKSRPAKTEETPLDIPILTPDSPWHYQIPQEKPIVLPEYERLPFSEIKERETSMSMNYADSISWSTQKISRDLLQNFFDGHGQTLDGVKMSFTPQENGKYKVRIEGQAQYTQEKAILFGESTKRNNAKAAGNFGEGLKVVVLKLLKDLGAEEVNIASDNWRVSYKAKESEICHKEVLTYSLLKEEPIEGNYIEFETSSVQLLASLREGINNFYHSHNTDFQNLDFENKLFGVKFLPKDETGSIYISGQKFEFGNDYSYGNLWRNVPGCTIVFKEKPSYTCGIDISRDRLRISQEDLSKMISACVSSEQISQEEIGAILLSLGDAWQEDENGSYYSYYCADSDKKMKEVMLKAIIKGCEQKRIKFNFPRNYLAGNGSIKDGYDYFYKDTHVICKQDFSKIGMKTTNEKAFEDRDKVLVEPTEIQIKKIGVIKEALECFRPSILKATYKFDNYDLNPNIYIFDEKGPFAGEHRKDGFWISSSELCSNFDRVISTSLHEICHKMGGDGTLEFTYALTDIIHAIINATLKDEATLLKLKALKSIWDELNNQEYQF